MDGLEFAGEALASVELEAPGPLAPGPAVSMGPVDVEPLAPPVADGFAALPPGLPALGPPVPTEPEVGRTEPEATGELEPEPVGKPTVPEPVGKPAEAEPEPAEPE